MAKHSHPLGSQGASRPTAMLIALALAFFTSSQETSAASVDRTVLRVCADANNLPFSNDRLEGFENKIAALIADELGVPIRYRFSASWSGGSLRLLRRGECDLVVSVPTTLTGVGVTRAYFTSTYVFVTARDHPPTPANFDNPTLRTMRIGLHTIGRGGANTPIVSALSRRGIHDNVKGYPMWGDDDATPGRLLAAVAANDIDTAIVWGPIAGFYAKAYSDQLQITPVSPEASSALTPFTFDFAFAVREGDDVLKAALESILDRREKDLRSILNSYGVPLADSLADTRTTLKQP